MKAKNLVLTALFASLTCASVFVSIPTPSMPITLQTFMVFLTGLILGGKRGAAALALYMLIGLVGLPVFSNMQGGAGFVLRPSFGFVIGFIVSAPVIGLVMGSGKAPASLPRAAAACVCGMLAIYAVGLPYMYFIFNSVMGTGQTAAWVLMNGMAIYLPGEAVKIAGAVSVYMAVRGRLKGDGWR